MRRIFDHYDGLSIDVTRADYLRRDANGVEIIIGSRTLKVDGAAANSLSRFFTPNPFYPFCNADKYGAGHNVMVNIENLACIERKSGGYTFTFESGNALSIDHKICDGKLEQIVGKGFIEVPW